MMQMPGTMQCKHHIQHLNRTLQNQTKWLNLQLYLKRGGCLSINLLQCFIFWGSCILTFAALEMLFGELIEANSLKMRISSWEVICCSAIMESSNNTVDLIKILVQKIHFRCTILCMQYKCKTYLNDGVCNFYSFTRLRVWLQLHLQVGMPQEFIDGNPLFRVTNQTPLLNK